MALQYLADEQTWEFESARVSARTLEHILFRAQMEEVTVNEMMQRLIGHAITAQRALHTGGRVTDNYGTDIGVEPFKPSAVQEPSGPMLAFEIDERAARFITLLVKSAPHLPPELSEAKAIEWAVDVGEKFMDAWATDRGVDICTADEGWQRVGPKYRSKDPDVPKFDGLGLDFDLE